METLDDNTQPIVGQVDNVKGCAEATFQFGKYLGQISGENDDYSPIVAHLKLERTTWVSIKSLGQRVKILDKIRQLNS
jgi:hypothetical protein